METGPAWKPANGLFGEFILTLHIFVLNLANLMSTFEISTTVVLLIALLPW